MAIRMTVVGERHSRLKPFREVEVFDTKREAVRQLRDELGYIYGMSDDEYVTALATVGVTVTFEEV